MDSTYNYDLIVIGAGPGGYVGAIRASQLGQKTAIVEKDKLGGVCLNVGCIPSKALIHSAEMYGSLEELEKMGIKVDRQGFDYGKVQQKSRQVSERLGKGIQFLMTKNKIEVFSEPARITGAHEISLASGKKLTARNILIATGSKPRELPGFPFDEETILSSTGALMLKKLPKSLVILGAGAIGIEFAHIMNAFGVEVHLVELLDHILPLEDDEIAEVVAKSFKRRKIKMHTGTKAVSCEKMENVLKVHLEKKDGSKLTVDTEKILVSIGRIPNSENLGLESVGVECEKGFIKTEDYYRTQNPSIYAVGDVIGSPLLAHIASKEAEIAVEHIAGKTPEPRLDLNAFPSAVYCSPEIGSFGYSEKEAQKKGISYEKIVFPYKGVGKAVAIDQTEGMVKVLYDPKTKEILGGHIVGACATELIHEILLAKKAELLPADIATMVHAHPTISEAVMEAMRAVEGWAIHF